MSQIIDGFEKYFRCVKLNMPRMLQNCTPPFNIGLKSLFFWKHALLSKGVRADKNDKRAGAVSDTETL